MMAIGARVINISESLMLYRIHDKHTSLSNHHESLSFKEQAKTIASFNQKYLTPEAYKSSWNNNQISYQVINGSINLTQSYLAQTKEENKLKILFALPFVITGGADTILLQIAKYLSENNFDISIITTIKTDPKFGDNTNKYEQITQEIYHLYNFLDSQGKWKDFVYYYLESRQINILFIVGSAYFYDLLPDIKRDFPHLKVVDQLFNEYGHITNNRKYAELIDMNILASQVIEDILLQEYQESKSKTRVIVHGVDTQKEFNSININQKLIRDIIPNGKFIVSYMGRFSEEKCPLKFVEIVDKLRDNKDIYFLMLGNGPEYDSVKVKISELGLDDKIYAPGFVYDNRPFLKTTKLLIIPSRIEGIPIILMEGLSLGVPVIASKIGGIPDIIIDGYNGFVCDPNNPDEFANKIIKIYSDKNLQNQLKTNARTYAEENLDITKMNNEYIIHDLDQFTLTARRVVFNGFGKQTPDSQEDFLLLMQESSEEDTKEMNKVLTHQESLEIVKEHVKVQHNKKTKAKRMLLTDKIFNKIIEDLNSRLVSNILSELVSKNLIETAFDEELNDFIFWSKEDENKTTDPKAE
jgi:glycosyltransferase involved in cell wall biosynthesis